MKVPARALATVLSVLLTVPVLAPMASAAPSPTASPAPRPAAASAKPGGTTTTTTSRRPSAPSAPRVVTYSIASKGKVSTDLGEFTRQVAETLADGRGWSRAGIRFEQVAKGGRFTVWLSAAGKVPTFGPPCASDYSCRAGRNVVINEDRWRATTASWKAIGGSVREYRNLVVNHEVGHWLGLGHTRCTRAGAVASVMQQQSKDLGGCVANAWPLDREVAKARVRN